jgi:hypothetical protein
VTIKNWSYFKDRNEMPYGSFFCIMTSEYKFIPLADPCKIHADGFDCYSLECTCAEFKMVRRTSAEKKQIASLQKENSERAILERARQIRKNRRAA